MTATPIDPRPKPRPIAYRTLPTVSFLSTVIALDGLPYSAWPLHAELTRLLKTDVEACRALLEACGFVWSARPVLRVLQGGLP